MHAIGVFPKWSRTFIEFSDFSEFGESDKSLKHESRLNFKILSQICVLLASLNSLNSVKAHLGKTPMNCLIIKMSLSNSKIDKVAPCNMFYCYFPRFICSLEWDGSLLGCYVRLFKSVLFGLPSISVYQEYLITTTTGATFWVVQLSGWLAHC